MLLIITDVHRTIRKVLRCSSTSALLQPRIVTSHSQSNVHNDSDDSDDDDDDDDNGYDDDDSDDL